MAGEERETPLSPGCEPAAGKKPNPRPTSSEGLLVAITVEAVYEDGVLKPAQPLPLKEHEKVSVTVEERRPSLAERIVARARALPPETLDRLPPDGASQHDHYIYGTPKRPE
jgi:predicted DNA-binding antitoxin AbrB/MazE fold protein